jgi:RND superfamily putative drug exporter
VPAIMQILGARAWWLPAWLDRKLPNLHVEPAEDDPAPTGEFKAVEPATAESDG